MTRLIIGQRDIDCFSFLHANKVTTAKQLHRAIFKNAYTNFCKKMRTYEKLKLVTRLTGAKDFDLSGVYELTKRGLNVVRANRRNVIIHDRYKSNSILHDLFLVEIRHIMRQKKSVTNYFSENQIQTFADFDSEDKLKAFKDSHCDAFFSIHNQDGVKISVALEFELSDKSLKDYKKKISNYYNSGHIHAIFYVCHNKQIELRIKKSEREVCKDSKKRIYFVEYEEFKKSTNSVTFRNQDQHIIEVY